MSRTTLLATLALAALATPFVTDPAPASAAAIPTMRARELVIADASHAVPASSATGFSGCTADQQVALRAALSRFDTRIGELARELDDATVSGPSDSLKKRLATWFHTNPGTDLKGLAAKIREGHQAMEHDLKSPMKVQCGHEDCETTGDDARQYGDTTVFCAPFFEDTTVGQVDTIVHEMSHRSLGTDDLHLKGTNPAECLKDGYAWGRFAVDGWTPVI